MKDQLWARMDSQPRRSAADLKRSGIPSAPGVYAWYRDGEAIYAGRALGEDGLRGRVGKDHLGVGNDLSRSSSRRNVCEHLGIASTSVTTQRPAQLTPQRVRPVNDWIRECEVTWLECNSADETKKLEKDLFAERMPPLSRR